MSAHLLVLQLHFTRSELMRCLEGVTEDEATKRPLPMNCISWIIGHLASQEHRYWVIRAQEKNISPGLDDLVGYGQPASTPPLNEMMSVWKVITSTADIYLNTLTPKILQTHFFVNGRTVPENVGTMLMRNIYHYWFHIGEAHAIRQMLGHKNLPDFVGNMSTALYVPE